MTIDREGDVRRVIGIAFLAIPCLVAFALSVASSGWTHALIGFAMALGFGAMALGFCVCVIVGLYLLVD